MAKNLMVLYGTNSICERLKADPKSIRKLFLEETFSDTKIEALIEKHGLRYDRVSAKDLARIKSSHDLQKIVAKVEQFAYTGFNDLLEPASERQVLIFLDGINDPHNVGVIIRTLACFGGFAVVMPARGACEINDTVLHVAQGGENYVPVAQVDDLAAAIAEARERGYTIVGSAVASDADDITQVLFPRPLGIVLGSEGRGMSTSVAAQVDRIVNIPMTGAPLSFNVNNACAIFCYEVARQR